MTSGPESTGVPPLLRRLLEIVLPADRRDDVLGDLAETHRARLDRMEPGRARRMLWREAAALVAWRARTLLRSGRPAPRRSDRREDGPGHPHRHTPHPRTDHTTTTRTTTMGRDLLQDLRFGVRSLLRRPGFSLMAVLVLALGIGAPTTVFSLVDAIFFRTPEQVAEPHRLVRLYRSWAPGQGGGSLDNADYRYYREGASTLAGLAAWGGGTSVAYTLGDGEPDQLDLTFTSDNYFDVLGTPLALGRGFRPEENETRGTHPVVVLSHGFWQRALGADPAAVGRSLTLNGTPFTVVGVAPEGFAGVSPVEASPDAWAPIAMFGTVNRAGDTAWWERLPNLRSRWLQVVGRLAPGVTHAAAEANLTALSDALSYEGRSEEEGLLVARQVMYRPSQEATLTNLSRMLLGAVALVLVIAMANVAVLLLSRASTRGREMGVRTALGAAGGRLTRQLLAESLVLGAVGGLLGIALAYQATDVAGSLLPLSFSTSFRPSPNVLAAAAALALLTAVLVGMAPALHTLRQDPARAIHGGRFASSGARVRHALVVGQVALSMVLLAGAFLFARSFSAAQNQPLGFETADRAIVQADLRALGYDAASGPVLVRQALERLEALPGVRGATTTRQVPFRGDWSTDLPRDPDGSDPEDTFVLYLNSVSPGFFEVHGVPIRAGRPLGREDDGDGTPAVVVNEAFVDLYWPGQNPVGRTLDLGPDRLFEIVGVAANATYLELGEQPRPQAYLSLGQFWQPLVHFLVWTDGEAASALPAVQRTLRELEPALAFSWSSTMEALVENETSGYEVSAVLVSAFGLVALLLAAAGLYGVVGFLVAQRTREIGIRMALGADRGAVAGRVLAFGVRLAALGVGAGLLGALLVRRFTTSLLFGVSPTDPVPLVLAGVALMAVTVAASWGPARRATRVDPLEAMRAE